VNAHEIKALETMLKKAEAVEEAARFEMENSRQHHMQALLRVEQLRSRLKDAQQEVSVTEHAMLRYLERVKGMDLEALRSEILTDNLKLQIETLGSGKFPIMRGVMAVVRGKNIVTIERKGERKNP